jgi:hypothetical protein
MASSPSVPARPPAPDSSRRLWSVTTAARPLGLALAREKGTLLAWDDNHWLYLLNRKGERQGQRRCAGAVAAGCCADEGSAYAAVGGRGEVWWLAPDLMTRWERSVPAAGLAAALDPFGRCLAVADAGGNLSLFDRRGRQLSRVQTPRPLCHLAFVPEAPRLLGGADLGLLACFDPAGDCLWREGLVAHIGALAVTGDGSRIALACFSEGLRFYSLAGRKEGSFAPPEPCRLVALTYDGGRLLAGGLGNRLWLLTREGGMLETLTLDGPAAGLALAPLGEWAAVALADGRILGLDLRAAPG